MQGVGGHSLGASGGRAFPGCKLWAGIPWVQVVGGHSLGAYLNPELYKSIGTQEDNTIASFHHWKSE